MSDKILIKHKKLKQAEVRTKWGFKLQSIADTITDGRILSPSGIMSQDFLASGS